MSNISKVDEVTVRRFVGEVRAHGSRRVDAQLRVEVRGILLHGHLAAAAACRQAGRGEEAASHVAWVLRLSAE